MSKVIGDPNYFVKLFHPPGFIPNIPAAVLTAADIVPVIVPVVDSELAAKYVLVPK